MTDKTKTNAKTKTLKDLGIDPPHGADLHDPEKGLRGASLAWAENLAESLGYHGNDIEGLLRFIASSSYNAGVNVALAKDNHSEHEAYDAYLRSAQVQYDELVKEGTLRPAESA